MKVRPFPPAVPMDDLIIFASIGLRIVLFFKQFFPYFPHAFSKLLYSVVEIGQHLRSVSNIAICTEPGKYFKLPGAVDYIRKNK